MRWLKMKRGRAKKCPTTKHHTILYTNRTWHHINPRRQGSHHDEVDVALVAESADKLGVLRVLAVLRQAAKAGRSAVEDLGAPVTIFRRRNKHFERQRVTRMEDTHQYGMQDIRTCGTSSH